MPMNPYQYQQPGAFPYVPGYQPLTMQQMVSQGYQPQGYQHPQPGITGRVVSSPDEIQVQEAPTDGTVAWFPAADGSCVYGKRWTPDGNITTLRFVPEAVEPAQSIPDPIAELNGKVDQALGMLAAMQPQGRSSRRSKAVSDDAE